MALDLYAATYRGITTPIRDLYHEIYLRGWDVGKVDWSNGAYTARASNEYGEALEAQGVTDSDAVGNLLKLILRKESVRQPFARVAAWDLNTLQNRMEEIAWAYAQAPVYDPKAAPAWQELAQDSLARAETIKQQIDVEFVPDPEPYQSPTQMFDDIHNNGHIAISMSNSQHPVWSTDDNTAFRLVHDVLGHAVSGGDFGWEGEIRACSSHAPLLSPLARQALFTECIAQTAAAAYYRSFFPQKVVMFDEMMTSIEEGMESQGTHPSQSLVPTQTPGIVPSQAQGLSWATQVPHTDFQGAIPVFGSAENPIKVIEGQQTLKEIVENVPESEWAVRNEMESWAWRRPFVIDLNTFTLYLGQRGTHHANLEMEFVDNNPALSFDDLLYGWVVANPTDVKKWGLGVGKQMDLYHAKDPALERQIWQAIYPDQPLVGADEDEWKLSAMDLADPNEEWSSGIPPSDETSAYLWHGDPLMSRGIQDMAHKLDTRWKNLSDTSQQVAVNNALRASLLSPHKSLKWNAIHYQDLLGIPHDTDDPYYLWSVLDDRRSRWNDSHLKGNPTHPFDQDALLLKRIEQTRNPDLPADEIESRVGRFLFELRSDIEADILKDKPDIELADLEKKVDRTLKTHLKALTKTEAPELDHPKSATLVVEDAYGGLIAQQIHSISRAAKLQNEIFEAAQEDDGPGYHFRKKLLELDIPGLGPKAISFAWFLLSPKTSELAIIDSDMMKVLGYKDSNITERDYARYERELAAGRDTAGYNHIPLGQFSLALWNFRRTPGELHDISAFKPINPTPHSHIDWDDNIYEDWEAPDWWEATKEAREQIGRDWDDNVASQNPVDKYPFVPRMGKLAAPKPNATPLEKYDYWWNKVLDDKGSFKTNDGRTMAEYAAGVRLSKKEAKEFLEKHKKDIKLIHRRGFDKKFWETLDRLANRMYEKEYLAKVAQQDLSQIPWIFSSGDIYTGHPGETYMALAKRVLQLTSQEVWNLIPEEEFAVGTFDPVSQKLDSGEPLTPEQEEHILASFLV